MISVLRLDGTPIVVNVDHIESIEETPDTVVTLSNGHKLLVKESAAELVRRAAAYKHAVLTGTYLTDAPHRGDPVR